MNKEVLSPLQNRINSQIHRNELIWLEFNGDREVMFPSSFIEFERIRKSTFRNLDVKTLPDDVFSLSTPLKAGRPPLLVCFTKQSRIVDIEATVKDKLGSVYGSVVSVKTDEGEARSLQVIACNAQNSGASYVVENYPEGSLPSLLETDSLEEWLSIQGDLLQDSNGLSMVEREQAWMNGKLAINMLMYRHVFPDKITPGTPPISVKNAMGKTPIKAKYTGGGADSEGGIVGVGYHMRCLRDERYYTSAEWNDKPRGSRWVSVDAYVKGAASTTIADKASKG